MYRKISATIASQHPDHAHKPYWHTEAFISTRSETEECFRAFSELGIDEYKWDWEGKFVDEGVIERLYSEHFDYFKSQQLGVDKFVTFRLPNPKGETEVRLGRAFMGILSAAILAEKIGMHRPPLFEVILPMTETAEELIYIQEAFAEMASLKHKLYMFHETSLKEIEMIPLFEDVETIMNSHKILEKYLAMRKKKFKTTPSLLRPYIARSDPALNSGLIPTVLATKVALSHYAAFEKEHALPLFPILGTASLPFRGGLTPFTVADFSNEYKGIRTALIQSAFRYDYKKAHVIKAISQLKELLPKTTAVSVSPEDEKEIRNIIPIFEKYYRATIEELAQTINILAAHLPKRRERVQHTGLFGYSRGVGTVKLP
ncbi:MAG TPA: phosphoenolpyruvate carboxylase, partial [Candidatus Saccharimonadales bacterium]|nr:phosphoenolpyruvate carboxylase [Candidatus Saccharimonadales bacterium]